MARTSENQILEAAMVVFEREGVEHTRVEDLIAAAGISRRTFYQYFKSKEAVLAALYELMTGTLLVLVNGDGGLPQIRAGIDAYLDFHAVSGRLLRFLTEQAMRSESLLFPRRSWLRDELVKILQAASRRATGKTRDPLYFYALISMVEGLSLHLLEHGATPGEVERAKRIVHQLTDELLGKAAT